MTGNNSTVETNYRDTVARPVCDSRASCLTCCRRLLGLQSCLYNCTIFEVFDVE